MLRKHFSEDIKFDSGKTFDQKFNFVLKLPICFKENL